MPNAKEVFKSIANGTRSGVNRFCATTASTKSLGTSSAGTFNARARRYLMLGLGPRRRDEESRI